MNIPEMSQTNAAEQFLDQLLAPSNRYIVVKVGDRLITFPDTLVSEIMIIDRNAIVALPFYETAIIGVMHHQANVMPLLLLRLVMGEQRTLIAESLSVIRLSKLANDFGNKNLGGVGVIVDRVIGSLTIDEHKDCHHISSDVEQQTFSSITDNNFTNDSTKKISQTVANIKENEYTPIEIILSSIPSHIWQPQRWQISS
jgi:chemotaxis signal transduction protein